MEAGRYHSIFLLALANKILYNKPKYSFKALTAFRIKTFNKKSKERPPKAEGDVK